VLPLQGLANVDLRTERIAEARAGFRRAIEIQRQHPIPEALAPLLITLASVELEDGRPAEAEPLLQETIERVAAPTSPSGHELLGAAKAELAKARRARGEGLTAIEPLVGEAEATLMAAGAVGEERLEELRDWWAAQQAK